MSKLSQYYPPPVSRPKKVEERMAYKYLWYAMIAVVVFVLLAVYAALGIGLVALLSAFNVHPPMATTVGLVSTISTVITFIYMKLTKVFM